MAATGDTLGALNEVHGVEKPDDIGLGEWIWGALQGDFNAERSAGQIGFDMVVSLIPVVDTVCDLRDLCANVRQYKKDPSNKVTLFFIATTIVGFFPEIGTVAKSVLRLVWVYLRPPHPACRRCPQSGKADGGGKPRLRCRATEDYRVSAAQPGSEVGDGQQAARHVQVRF